MSSPAPRPKINDQYWFDVSETVLNNSIKNLDSGLSKLNNFIVALWAIYLAASIFTIDYLELTERQYYYYILVPHIVLLIGRWMTIQGQMPVSISFHPTAPDTIENAYKKTYSIKKRFLIFSGVLSFIATVLIILTLTFSFLENNKVKKKKFELENRINPNLDLVITKEKTSVVFVIENTPKTLTNILIYNISKKMDTSIIYKKNCYSSTKGIISDECLFKKEYNGQITAKATWLNSSSKTDISLSKTVLIEKGN